MSKYNPHIHHRRSIRLKGYDYTQSGLYFITICCQGRICRFGDVVNGEMKLNDAGTMVENEWLKLPGRFNNIQLHEHVVMPNHFHAILEIVGATLVVARNDINSQNDLVARNDINSQIDIVSQNDLITRNDGIQKGQPQGIAPSDIVKNKTVGDMMGAFKSITTVEYIRGVQTLGWQPFDGKLWQRNYYEHIIRNERSYQTISDYIMNNPSKWLNDKFFR